MRDALERALPDTKLVSVEPEFDARASDLLVWLYEEACRTDSLAVAGTLGSVLRATGSRLEDADLRWAAANVWGLIDVVVWSRPRETWDGSTWWKRKLFESTISSAGEAALDASFTVEFASYVVLSTSPTR